MICPHLDTVNARKKQGISESDLSVCVCFPRNRQKMPRLTRTQLKAANIYEPGSLKNRILSIIHFYLINNYEQYSEKCGNDE